MREFIDSGGVARTVQHSQHQYIHMRSEVSRPSLGSVKSRVSRTSRLYRDTHSHVVQAVPASALFEQFM